MAAVLTTIYAEVVKTTAIRNQIRGSAFPEIKIPGANSWPQVLSGAGERT